MGLKEDTALNVNIGKNIRTIRKQQKLTQNELADKMNISRSYLGDLENNRRNPSIDTISSLANALNIDINQILKTPNSTVPSDNKLKIVEKIQTKSSMIFKISGENTHKWNFVFVKVVPTSIILDKKYYVTLECSTDNQFNPENELYIKQATDFLITFFTPLAISDLTSSISKELLKLDNNIFHGFNTVRFIWNNLYYSEDIVLVVDKEVK
jgi:transcriptional regulator with XRE-family HTH domain